MYSVHYIDKRGAGCSKNFAKEIDLSRFVMKLHYRATIKKDNVIIGKVFHRNDDPLLSSDTCPRRKWFYWFEGSEE